MALYTVEDYVKTAQTFLNDVSGTRYTNDMLMRGVNQGLSDMRRLRPDVFMEYDPPIAVVLTDVVDIDTQFKPALLDYIVGYAERFDQETSDTSRATAYTASFIAKMTGSAA